VLELTSQDEILVFNL